MKTLSVFLVALIELLGYSFFIVQPEDQCSPAPTLGSWLFLLATLCFLWDLGLYPRRFVHMAWQWQLLVEVVVGVFLAEIATLIIWCGLERIIYWLTQQLIHMLRLDSSWNTRTKYWLHGLTTVTVSGALTWFIFAATDVSYYFSRYMADVRHTGHYIMRVLTSISRMNRCDRRRVLKACKLTMFPPEECEVEDEADDEVDCEGDESEEDDERGEKQ